MEGREGAQAVLEHRYGCFHHTQHQSARAADTPRAASRSLCPSALSEQGAAWRPLAVWGKWPTHRYCRRSASMSELMLLICDRWLFSSSRSISSRWAFFMASMAVGETRQPSAPGGWPWAPVPRPRWGQGNVGRMVVPHILSTTYQQPVLRARLPLTPSAW